MLGYARATGHTLKPHILQFSFELSAVTGSIAALNSIAMHSVSCGVHKNKRLTAFQCVLLSEPCRLGSVI